MEMTLDPTYKVEKLIKAFSQPFIESKPINYVIMECDESFSDELKGLSWEFLDDYVPEIDLDEAYHHIVFVIHAYGLFLGFEYKYSLAEGFEFIQQHEYEYFTPLSYMVRQK